MQQQVTRVRDRVLNPVTGIANQLALHQAPKLPNVHNQCDGHLAAVAYIRGAFTALQLRHRAASDPRPTFSLLQEGWFADT